MWSPKYEIFHHILQSAINDISGIIVHPIFLKQSLFERKTTGDTHFFTGNSIKMRILLAALEKHANEYIILSDADICVFDDDNTLVSYMKSYEKNEITCMREAYDNPSYNIGVIFIHSTNKTIAFIKRIICRIEMENGHDQGIFNEEIKHFSGEHGSFSIPDVIQSNMIEISKNENHRIIQCLSSGNTYEDNLTEKILTIIFYYDISNLLHFLPIPVIYKLIPYLSEMSTFRDLYNTLCKYI